MGNQRNKKENFTISLPGFAQRKEKTPKEPKKKRGHPIQWVTDHFAMLSRYGDPELFTDLKKNEFEPENKDNKRRAIAAGFLLSQTEQNTWNGKVRFKIREITEIKRLEIAPGSVEEQEVLAAVWEFKKNGLIKLMCW